VQRSEVRVNAIVLNRFAVFRSAATVLPERFARPTVPV